MKCTQRIASIWNSCKDFTIQHIERTFNKEENAVSGWLDRIASIWNSRKDFTIQHIERTFNKEANALSKGLSSPN